MDRICDLLLESNNCSILKLMKSGGILKSLLNSEKYLYSMDRFKAAIIKLANRFIKMTPDPMYFNGLPHPPFNEFFCESL